MPSSLLKHSDLLDIKTVPVQLGDRSYDILIGQGLLNETGVFLSQLRPGVKCSIITDETVAFHHLATLKGSLESEGIACQSIVLKPGEATKSFEQLSYVVETLLAHEIERGDLVIALGGGVIGDLAGFAASILRRGVDFVQIPTTLLAQVDSSVGGKTGINSQYGKNLIGAFHQPILVLCDTDVLKTLDQRQFHAGYAEVVKYALIRDAAFYDWLDGEGKALFLLAPDALQYAIETSCKMKARIVAEDEKEHGVRALLNLGHTFGHAFESLTGYGDTLLHGEAISIGMVLAFEFSERLGYSRQGLIQKVEAHFQTANLPTRIQDISSYKDFTTDTLIEKMRQDKKVERGNLVFILVHDLGEAFVAKTIEETALRAFLSEKLSSQ